jgi:hypothetical protein
VSSFGNLIRSVVAALSTTPVRKTESNHHRPADTANRGLRSAPDEPGRSGSSATVEVDPASIGRVRMTYVPSTDGDPDPGEIVWTWVPYEERDGRGKDRPVLIVAEEPSGTRLAVQLTSKPHDGSEDYVPIGSGPWDAQGRPSWVNVDRVFRVYPEGMRREAAAIDKSAYVRVAGVLRDLYGWR